MNIMFMEETRNKYKVLVGKVEGKISPARPRCRSQHSVKTISTSSSSSNHHHHHIIM
jgi:hypothetical protein